MSIEQMRSSLNSDDLKVFDDIINKHDFDKTVEHNIISFENVENFIVESRFNSYPKTGLRCFRNGELAHVACY